MVKFILKILLFLPFVLAAHQNTSSCAFNSFPYKIKVTFEKIFTTSDSNIAISLSDGSQWIIQNHLHETFDQYSSEFQSGDEIRIRPNKENKYFILKNVRNNKHFLVKLDRDNINSSKMPRIKKIEKKGYIIKTTDNKKWIISYTGSFATSHWHKNDRLIINKSSYFLNNDYLIINIEDNTHVWACLITRQID